MNVWRSTKGGLVGTLLAPLLWILATVVAPMTWQILRAQLEGPSSWDATSPLNSNHLLVAAVVGFAAGFYWRSRRQG